MTSTAANFFGFRRAPPIAAASRFRAIHNLFHHHPEYEAANAVPLRHASAMSSAILRNMSTTLGEPSQLVDPSSSFEADHRHYSFITVLAIMSLFILITVSIVALLLGFCRKKNTVFALRNGSQDKNTASAGDVASQFELDDMDADLTDVETKVCRDDPTGACYYHLSDNDDDDYADDISDSDEDYMQVNCRADKQGRTTVCDSRKRKGKQLTRRQRRKRKLRFKDSSYYYHLHKEEDSEDDYTFDQRGWSNGEGNRNKDNSPPSELSVPKRSTTFPQLHNVLTSCIRGETLLPQQLGYQRLSLEASPSHPQPKMDKTSPVTKSNSSGNEPPRTSCSTVIQNSDQASAGLQQTIYPQQEQKAMTGARGQIDKAGQNSPARLHPESTHLIRINQFNTQQSVLADKRRMGPSVFLPAAGGGRLIKAYSLHDIPRSRAKKQNRYKLHQHAYNRGLPLKPLPHHVTFKVGVLARDADIRVHHPNT